MAARTDHPRPRASGAGEWLRGFWEYYRAYTKTGVHAAATASLTALGLLIFIDPLFAWLAIASYAVPPVVLYASSGSYDPNPSERDGGTDPSETVGVPTDPGGDANRPGIGAGVDADADGPDFDADGPDMDADGADADADGPDRDMD